MVMKILASVLVVILTVMINLALFEIFTPQVLVVYLLTGLCSFIVFIVWS